MADQAALFGTGGIVGLCPFEKFAAGDSHVAARFETLAVAGRFALAQSLNAHGRVQPQEDDEVIGGFDRPRPFRRRSREHPLPGHGKQPKQHGLPLVPWPLRRERRVGRQPEEAVGVDMGVSKPLGEGRSQRRRARAGGAENMEPGHGRRRLLYSAACALAGAIAFMVPP